MNLQALLPLASQAVGRDLSVELNLFYRARAAVGSALTQEGQLFFSQNWPKLVDFMETPEGKKAVASLVDAWAQSFVPKSFAKPPESAV